MKRSLVLLFLFSVFYVDAQNPVFYSADNQFFHRRAVAVARPVSRGFAHIKSRRKAAVRPADQRLPGFALYACRYGDEGRIRTRSCIQHRSLDRFQA